MYDQMVSQQQYLITSQILQIVESSRQHITHTFTFLKEGEQSLALPHFSKQNQGLRDDSFGKLFLWLKQGNGQMNESSIHCPSDMKLPLLGMTCEVVRSLAATLAPPDGQIPPPTHTGWHVDRGGLKITVQETSDVSKHQILLPPSPMG